VFAKPFDFLIMKALTLLLIAWITSSIAMAQPAARIEISCNDQMKFSTKALQSVVGQKITLVFKNVGKIPLEKMAHNFVILKPGTNVVNFVSKCGSAASGYLPEDPEMKKLILASTKRLGGGESDTIYFIPKESGEYPFLCTTPGHFSEMQGIMTVKDPASP
jgi:azurin